MSIVLRKKKVLVTFSGNMHWMTEEELRYVKEVVEIYPENPKWVPAPLYQANKIVFTVEETSYKEDNVITDTVRFVFERK